MKPNVWLYLRKSRFLGDPDDPTLLQAHRAILQRLAEADEIVVPPAHVIAEVESGEFIATRPEFRAFLEAIERLPAGAGGILYTIALDRLSRGDEREQARVRYALRRAGILIRTPSGTIDLSDPDAALLAGVRGELARHELARFKARLAQARAEKLRRGEVPTGEVPWGYRWSRDEQRPVPHPERFPILVACCREVLTTSVARLAARYRVSYSCLQRALHSPVICGWAAHRYITVPHRTAGTTSALLPRERWVWAERPGDWEPACTLAEWEAIQTALSARDCRREWTAREDGWSRDVLRLVGAPAGAWARMQTGGGHAVYAVVDPVTRKVLGYVRRDRVHAHVTAAIAPVLSRPDTLANALARWEGERAPSAPVASEAELQAAIEERRALLDRLARQEIAADEEESRASFARLRRELEGELRDLRRRLRETQSAAAPPDLTPLLRELAGLTDDTAAAWEAAPGGLRRPIVAALIAAVPFRITEEPHRQPRRELLPVEWQEWVRPLVERTD